MNYGSFQSTKAAVNQFVFDEIIKTSLLTQPPETLNLSRQFATFLAQNNFHRLRAEEEAEKQIFLLRRRLDEALDEWKALGLPPPLGYSENGDVLLTWRHQKYAAITGRDPLSPNFVVVFDWLSGLNARQYLLPSVLFLKLMGCDPIFVTDGPHDEGIDCIGRIAEGPLRSVLVFVQVKTQQAAQRHISKDSLFQEYGKYATLPKTEKYREYLRALNFDEIRDGSSAVYLMISNVEFGRGSQEVARNLGIILRSKRQIAHFLSVHTTFEKLQAAEGQGLIPPGPDLGTSLARRLDPFLSIT